MLNEDAQGDVVGCSDPCQQEVLSVPESAETSDGEIRLRFGVAPYQAERTVDALDPDVFEFDGSEVSDCVCDERCNDSQDTDLLTLFGFDSCGSC